MQQQQQGGESSSAGRGLEALQGSVRVEVCGESVYVSAQGCTELQVQLPFAVSPKVGELCLGADTESCKDLYVRGYVAYAV